MARKKKIVFLIPALNEEKGIGKTLSSIPLKELSKKGYKCEIVVVDGKSTDKTTEVAKKTGARVIVSPKRGYGFQYQYAISKIKGDYVITGDADGTYPQQMAPLLIEILEKNNLDFVTTNRFASLKKGSMSFMHFLGNKILTYTGNLLFGLSLKDNQSGMWCFKLDKIRNLGAKNEDMAFSEELKILAFKKLRAAEIPISYHPRVGKSKLNYGHAIKNFLYLFKLRLTA